MKNILKHVFLNKYNYIIGLILLTSFALMSFAGFKDHAVWWDQAVYIGMGKYIATGGHIGMWEAFRPPLFPLIYALLYKLHLPLIFAGKLIVILSSIGSMFVVYLIGESIHKKAGIFASIFLFSTPVFFSFSKVAITDIFSSFIILLSVLFFIKNKYFLAGIFIGLAFLLRFPQGLILLPLGICVLYQTYNSNLKIWFKELLLKEFSILLGFSILVIPYFVSNYLMYGNILMPIILGSGFVGLNNLTHYLYDLGTFYYFKELFNTAPFLYFTVLLPLIFLKKEYFSNINFKKNTLIILIIGFVFLLYFTWQPHKELRYSLGFVPYFAILAGVSFSSLTTIFKRFNIIIIVLCLLGLFFIYKSFPIVKYNVNTEYIPFYNYIDTLDGKYLTTLPIPSALGEIKVVSLFSSSDDFMSYKDFSSIDGVIVNSCDLFCSENNTDGNCDKDLVIINNKINDLSYKKTYETVINKCTFSVYKK